MMMNPVTPLTTPVFLKTDPDQPWPEDEKIFYLLTGSGLFLCRNHPFFRSSVPARGWPSELAAHGATLALRTPKLSKRLFERVVGYFDVIAKMHSSEAAVLLAWDNVANRVRLVVPDQVATVSKSWSGRTYPVGVRYDAPADLPAHLTVFGDIHSHVDDPAYSSFTDKEDETHRAGLHIVVGRINQDPPEIHAEAVADGTRFHVKPELVLEGYTRRRTRVPRSWIDKVKVETLGGSSSSYSYGGGGYVSPYAPAPRYYTPYTGTPKSERRDQV